MNVNVNINDSVSANDIDFGVFTGKIGHYTHELFVKVPLFGEGGLHFIIVALDNPKQIENDHFNSWTCSPEIFGYRKVKSMDIDVSYV